MKVAGTVTVKTLDALAFKAEQGAGLGARRNFNGGFAIQGWHLDFGAKRGRDKTHWNLPKQAVAVALKDLMRLDMKHDIQIPGRPAAQSGFAMADGAQAEAGIHSGRDAQCDLGGALAAAGAAAGLARFFDDAARTLAVGAGLCDAEYPPRSQHLAASA